MTPHRLGNLATAFESRRAVVEFLVTQGFPSDHDKVCKAKEECIDPRNALVVGIREYNESRGRDKGTPILLNTLIYTLNNSTLIRIDTSTLKDDNTGNTLVLKPPAE